MKQDKTQDNRAQVGVLNGENIRGKKPFLKGILKREEKKMDFSCCGSGAARMAEGPCNGRTRQWLRDLEGSLKSWDGV